MGLSIVDYSSAVLHNGLGNYQEALRAAEQGAGYPDELGFSTWSLVELIEAAARSGHPDSAADAFELLTRTTSASGTDWALGIESRSHAQVSQGEAAEGYYVEAVERLGRTRMRVEHARAQLLYGEWLRRENRRREARNHLRSAYDLLTEMGVGGLRRTSPSRTGRHRRDAPQAIRRGSGGVHGARGSDCSTGGGGAHEPRDRC